MNAPVAQLLLFLLLCCAAAAAALRATPSGACPLQATSARRKARHAKECSSLVHKYMAQHTADLEASHDVNKMVFFLHVPRTAGKTYANCFLRTALPPSQRCAKSYDVLRLNVSAPNCLSLISHDDFSISQFFPPGAATITQLRRPVDRIVSSYEFAVDVAAKGVLSQHRPLKNFKRRADFVGTLEVWPWSVLVPWFKQDMKQRLDKLREATEDDVTAWREYKSPENRKYYWNEAKNLSLWELPDAEPVLDPYNNSLVMPLHEFIEHPIAEELLHNGATLQVLGLTNYSYWAEEGQELRHCVQSSWVAREMLLALATKRLRSMSHVGLTERLDESVASMAADLGLNFSGPAYKYTSASAFSYDLGAVDYSDPVTFNASTQGGINVTLARSQAAQRLLEIMEEQKVLKKEIDLLTPRLTELVEKEAKWLEEQEEQQRQHTDEAAADADAEGKEGEGAEEEGEGRLAGGGGGPAGQVDATGAASAGTVEAGAEAGAGAAAAEDEAEAQGAEEAEEGGTTEGADGTTKGLHADGAEGERGGNDAHGAAAGEEGQEGQVPQQEGQPQQEEQQEEEPIDSPWAKDIEELDSTVSDKQGHLKQLEAELASLQHSELIVPVDAATGQARQLIPDDHFLLPHENLGQAYRRCADAGKGRNEKRKPYKHLRTPWGETFVFTPEARRQLSAATLARIHQLNAMDEELWKAGNEILERKLAEQRAAGLLQGLPPGPQQRSEGPPAPSRRRLSSLKELQSMRQDQWHKWQQNSFNIPANKAGEDLLYQHPSPPPPPPEGQESAPPDAEQEAGGAEAEAAGSGVEVGDEQVPSAAAAAAAAEEEAIEHEQEAAAAAAAEAAGHQEEEAEGAVAEEVAGAAAEQMAAARAVGKESAEQEAARRAFAEEEEAGAAPEQLVAADKELGGAFPSRSAEVPREEL